MRTKDYTPGPGTDRDLRAYQLGVEVTCGHSCDAHNRIANLGRNLLGALKRIRDLHTEKPAMGLYACSQVIAGDAIAKAEPDA
jgi:hypothetical protein